MAIAIAIDKEKLAEVCRRYPIARLSLFGSALTGDFNEKSDIDLLVDLDPDSGVGYFELVRMQREFRKVLGRKVDLRTFMELSRYFRDKVRETALVLYEKR